MSAQTELHAQGVEYAINALRRRGCAVTRTDGTCAVTCLVNGLAVGVRVARTRVTKHPVTVGGRRYSYRYPILHWNLHVHGQKVHSPDVWLLVAIGPSPRPRVFIVPADVVGRTKTAQVLDTPSARTSTRGRLRAYEGAWGILTAARRRERAA